MQRVLELRHVERAHAHDAHEQRTHLGGEDVEAQLAGLCVWKGMLHTSEDVEAQLAGLCV